MSPNYPGMVFAFFSFLWSSTCCGFSANTICMPDHEVFGFFCFFSKPSLGCSCVLPHHSHCTWVSYEGQPCHARNVCSELQPSAASGAWLELESPSSCSFLVCLSWKDPLSFGSTLYFFRAHKQFKETYGKECYFSHCLVSCSFLHP